jgi:hypothetical protein
LPSWCRIAYTDGRGIGFQPVVEHWHSQWHTPASSLSFSTGTASGTHRLPACHAESPSLRECSVRTHLIEPEPIDMCDLGVHRRMLTCIAVLVFLCALGRQPVAWGDVFELAGGGQLQGQWLNRDEPSAARYEMRTTQGVLVVLDRASVLDARQEISVEQQYREELAHHGDDVAGQWALAQWCREHALDARREEHLRRILELDPNHLEARVALGYSQIGGRWITREEMMRERGYVLYRGRWCLSQQVELMETQRRRELAERQWYRQLVRWRHDLSTNRGGDVKSLILAIRDPFAVPGVAAVLSQETTRAPKVLWIHTLANIRTPEAVGVLVDVVLQDNDVEIVHSALDCLVEIHSPSVQRQFEELLRHESNQYVNRAGLALGRLGERSAIDSLIDALITQHSIRLGGPPSLEPPRIVSVQLKNAEVLAALNDLTNTAGYGYDQQAWKQWRFLQNKQAFAKESASADVRRGE